MSPARQAGQRTIAKPVAGTVRVAVDGVETAVTTDTTTGLVSFAAAPAAGAVLTAGFEFDTPVRFDTDQLAINLASFNAGEIPSIPIVEILRVSARHINHTLSWPATAGDPGEVLRASLKGMSRVHHLGPPHMRGMTMRVLAHENTLPRAPIPPRDGTTTLVLVLEDHPRRRPRAGLHRSRPRRSAFDGVTYEAVSGFTASEVQSQLNLAIDNLTVAGALSSATLNEADLAAGLYDDAAIEIWRVNWADTSQRVLMRKGNLGQVTRGRTAFQAEMRGLAHVLNQPVGRAYAYGCDADLGDARCTVNLADPAYTASGAVAAVIDARRFTASGLGAFADGWFADGKLGWTSGANAGRAMEIKRHGVSTRQCQPRTVAGDERAHRRRRRLHRSPPAATSSLQPARPNSPTPPISAAFPTCPATTRSRVTRPRSQPLDGGSRYGN